MKHMPKTQHSSTSSIDTIPTISCYSVRCWARRYTCIACSQPLERMSWLRPCEIKNGRKERRMVTGEMPSVYVECW